MRRIFALFFVSLLAASSAWADEQRTTTTEEQAGSGRIRDEVVGIKPMLGVLSFDYGVDKATRGALGIQLDANFAKSSGIYIGAQTGVLFSRIGDPGSNFFGSTSDTGSNTSNVLIVPANLKVGANMTDRFRLSAHGGGNFLYSSRAGAIPVGTSGVFGSPNWSLLPNVGAELEFGISPSATLSLRPDWTIAPQSDVFSAALVLGLSLG